MTTDLMHRRMSVSGERFEAVFPVSDQLGWALAVMHRALFLSRPGHFNASVRLERKALDAVVRAGGEKAEEAGEA